MPTIGIDLRGLEAQMPGSGWTPPDPGVQMFEIMSLTPGITKNGDPFVQAKCFQISGDDPGTKSTSLFMGLSTEKKEFGIPAAQTKGILESLGRHDIIEQGSDADWDNLIGTTFEAEVVFKTDAKSGKSNAKLYKYMPVSHAGLEPMEEAAPEPAPEPAPAKPPVTMKRGR